MVNTGEFSKRLQKILDYYGLSATGFSEKIDFNRSTISHLLSGRNKPSLEFVLKVLKQFPEVELYWLLNGSGKFPSNESGAQKEPPSSEIAESSSVENIETTLISPKENSPVKISEATSEEILADKKIIHPLSKKVSDSEIDRIVIFYKDGSFRSYQ